MTTITPPNQWIDEKLELWNNAPLSEWFDAWHPKDNKGDGQLKQLSESKIREWLEEWYEKYGKKGEEVPELPVEVRAENEERELREWREATRSGKNPYSLSPEVLAAIMDSDATEERYQKLRDWGLLEEEEPVIPACPVGWYDEGPDELWEPETEVSEEDDFKSWAEGDKLINDPEPNEEDRCPVCGRHFSHHGHRNAHCMIYGDLSGLYLFGIPPIRNL